MLSKLKALLDKRYGPEWLDLEPETISLDLGVHLDPASLDRILMLKTVVNHPEFFEDDADYFLRFAEVANGRQVDPDHAYIPNSLEVAWTLVELQKLIPKLNPNDAIATICHYILQDEGYGEFCPPFNFIQGKTLENKWQSKEDSNRKARAILLYIKAMEKQA